MIVSTPLEPHILLLAWPSQPSYNPRKEKYILSGVDCPLSLGGKTHTHKNDTQKKGCENRESERYVKDLAKQQRVG